jgi:hypothetical protein
MWPRGSTLRVTTRCGRLSAMRSGMKRGCLESRASSRVWKVIPMKKRTYRKIALKEIDVAALAADLGSGRAVFAIDVAKVDMVAAIVSLAAEGRCVFRRTRAVVPAGPERRFRRTRAGSERSDGFGSGVWV